MRRTGLTLLELLLVVVILAAVATAAVNLTDQVDLQSRYDETRNRAGLITQAIAGHPERTVNGEPDLAGFVADMGRLPAFLDELTLAPTTTAYATDIDGKSINAGWRGPYLRALNTDGSFPDGWGNVVDTNDPTESARNFGWIYAAGALKTKGADGRDDIAPVATYDADVTWTTAADDWTADLSGLVVHLMLRSTSPEIDKALEIRVYFPVDGADAPLRYISARFTYSGTSIETDVMFPAQSTRIPVGNRSIGVYNTDGTKYGNVSRARQLLIVPRLSRLPSITWSE